MSLKRTELLCLRISDGLGRQRDFDELKRRNIDVDGWVDLARQMGDALRPQHINERIADRVMGDILSEADIDHIDLADRMLLGHSAEIVDSVLENLLIDEGAMRISRALAPNHQPELHNRILDQLELEEARVDLRQVLLPQRQPDLSRSVMQELLQEELNFGDLLRPTQQPDLSQKIMQSLDIHVPEFEVVEADFIDEAWLGQQEEELGFDIGSALKPKHQVDLWQQLKVSLKIETPKKDASFSHEDDRQANDLPEIELSESDIQDNILSFPVIKQEELFEQDDKSDEGEIVEAAILEPELPVVDVAEDSEEDSKAEIVVAEVSEDDLDEADGEDYSEALSETAELALRKAVVIDFAPPAEVVERSGPAYPVDEPESEEVEQASSSYAVFAFGVIAAVAAGLLMMFQFDTPIEDPITEGEEVLSVAAVNELEVESLEVGDDVMVQIFQSEENAPTIIFIDDSLIVGEDE